MAYECGEIAARVFRGDAVEAIHCASIVVVDKNGDITHSLGDPGFVTMARSSIKPFQLMPLLLSGAADKYGFTPEQLAIMSGSHTGTDHHRETVLANLAAAGNKPEDLKCGCHWPIGMLQQREYPTSGEDKDPARHNCSGKHSGFLALSRFLGEDVSTYLAPDSHTQKLVLKAVSDYCEFPQEKMGRGTDGCSAPNFSMPLYNFALGFKKLANCEGDSPDSRRAAERICEAIKTYPEMVSGEGRFDLDLMRSLPNNIVCKIGAESIEAFGLSDPPIGIAVKIHDGNTRALGAVCIEVLRQLDVLRDPAEIPSLRRLVKPEIRNVSNLLTGTINVCFELKRL